MKTFGSKQRLCMGAWVLAALILIGVNGSGYLGLESRPLEGDSMAIKSLRQKLARLDSAIADHVLNALDDDQKLSVSLLTAQRTGANSPETGLPLQRTGKIVLPGLTGIVQVANPSGAPYFMAVIDGKACRERDRIGAFVVGKISAKGVVLRRAGGQWFIESPTPRYSNDQGK